MNLEKVLNIMQIKFGKNWFTIMRLLCCVPLFLYNNLAQAKLFGVLDIPLLDNQPNFSDACPITNTEPTERILGVADVRQYGCDEGGKQVVYTVSIPSQCKNVSCGLIVDIHGAVMNANEQNAGTQLRQYALEAEKLGATTPYIVIQPNFSSLFTNGFDFTSIIGGGYWGPYKTNLDYFVQNAIATLNIDPNRIHAHGFSRGAFTVDDFICYGPSIFASMAQTGGAKNECKNQQGEMISNLSPIPLLMINGRHDWGQNTKNALNASRLDAYAKANHLPIENTSIHVVDGWDRFQIALPPKSILPAVKMGYHHVRKVVGPYFYEFVEHVGLTIPLLGHCNFNTSGSSWLVCYADVDQGYLITRFFIEHPKKQAQSPIQGKNPSDVLKGPL